VTPSLYEASWPAAKLGEALEALSRSARIGVSGEVAAVSPRASEQEGPVLERWLEAALEPLRLEAEPISSEYGGVEAMLRGAAPAFVALSIRGERRWLLLVGSRGGSLTALAPDLGRAELAITDVAAVLRAPLEESASGHVDAVLDAAQIDPARRAQVRRELLREQLRASVAGVWLLRPTPGAGLWQELRLARLPGAIGGIVLCHAASFALLVASWVVIGRSALAGRFDGGWLAAWALLLLSAVPFTLAVTWLQGRFAIGLGGVLKQRLLYGVLRLEPDEIRHMGAGRLLGRVLESDAVEALALSGGMLVLLSAVELIGAGIVLIMGGGALFALLLVAWLGLALLLGWRYYRTRRRWATDRVELTDQLVERLVGHRTRLAQLLPAHWHEGEDQSVDGYLERSRALDKDALLLLVVVPRGWLLVAALGLGRLLFAGAGAVELAIAVGAMWLVYLALTRAVGGVAQIAGAAVAWEQIAPVYQAAARPVAAAHAAASLFASGEGSKAEVLLEAREIVFHYDRGPRVLHGCDLRIGDGDRILLEGASGGGKSTLANVIAGLREPRAGLLLLRGLDRATLGPAAWRRRIAAAPQFHENHVLSGTFAFNLLMGSRWPPSRAELEMAEALCRDLGLGPLLARMPAGLLQVVGETGWQLSHGEKSRLFMARALLQGAELVVLDESFASLDPEGLRDTLGCVLERTPTLLVIAHP
jgi:ATP-binding cassette subfamily B protein